ncbi:MAG TPA: Ech hydrogenase subunit EchB [Clostridiaceae bacterium]|nr:Ech hydrogenase subunit EchB [Clostridiaceae bacterium]
MIYILKIFLVMILSPVAGCLLKGLDRKITARLQHREGPPILQPFYDFLKLISKENIAVSKYQNIFVLIYFMFAAASLLMMFFQMDLLMIICVFTISNVALITAGMSTGSPYSKVGSEREIISMLCYEPVLVFFIVEMYMLTGSFRISSIDHLDKPLIFYMPLAFLSMLYIMLIKFKKSPFDLSSSHHAHQELVKGIMTEFSGPALAVIELTHWYEAIFLLGLMFIFAKQYTLLGLAIAAFTYIFAIIIDNISARLTWQWMLKFTWTVVIELTIVNLLGIYFLNLKAL